MKTSENEWLFRCVISLLVGIILGVAILAYEVSVDCRENGYTNFAGGLHCSQRYADTIKDE